MTRDALEHALYVPQIVKQIGTDHKIELFFEIERVRVGLKIANFRMPALRPFYPEQVEVLGKVVGVFRRL